MDVGSNKSRKDTRAVVSLVARYRSPSTFEYVQEACCDVSVGGMFIQSSDPAAAGTLLKLECEANSSAEKIRGVARVVWLRRENNEYGPSGMGVKFVKLEPGCRETITRIVQENSAAGIEPQSMSSAPESRGKPPGVHASRSKSNGKAATSPHPAVAPPSAPKSPPAPASPAAASPVAPAPAPISAATAAAPEATPVAEVIPAVVASAPSDTARTSGRSSKPEVVAAAPRDALDTHSASAPSVRPVAAEPARGRGGIRVWWLVAVAIAAGALYLLSKKDAPSASAPSAAATTQAAEPAAAATAVAERPAVEGKEPQAEAQPVGAESPTSAPEQAAAPAPAQETATSKPEQAADTQAAEPAAAAEPATKAEASAAPAAAKPASAATPQPTAAATQPAAAVAAQPSAAAAAAAASDRPPLAPGQVPYIMSFVTRPTGATVTIGTQTVVAPGELDLGAMPPRVKVTAQKDGYESSSVWLDRETEFVRSNNAYRRKVYLTLHALPGTPANEAPKP